MPDYRFEDKNEPYHNPNLNEFEDYSEEDLAHLFKQGDFNSWQELIDWLHDFGGEDNFLHPGKIKNIHDDLERLKDANEVFSKDPLEIYKKAKGYREA